MDCNGMLWGRHDFMALPWDCHGFKGFHGTINTMRLPWDPPGLPWLQGTAMGCHRTAIRLTWYTIGRSWHCHRAAMDCHGMPWDFMALHRTAMASRDFMALPWQRPWDPLGLPWDAMALQCHRTVTGCRRMSRNCHGIPRLP